MRHKVFGRKLNRNTNERKRLFRNISRSLILNGHVRTTLARAKAVQPFIEKLITKAKENNLRIRRILFKELVDKKIVEKTTDIAKVFRLRKGGYTRITKLALRAGDNASEVIISFTENIPTKEADFITKDSKKEIKQEAKIKQKVKENDDTKDKKPQNK